MNPPPELRIPLRGLAAQPRRVWALAALALFGLVILLIGLATSSQSPRARGGLDAGSPIRPSASTDSAADASTNPEQPLPAQPSVAQTNLGEAPYPARFDQTWRSQFEQRMHEQLDALRGELEAREQARSARDSAQLDSVARMVNEASVRTVAPPVPSAAVAGLSASEPRFVLVREGTPPVGDWPGLPAATPGPMLAPSPATSTPARDGPGMRTSNDALDPDGFVVPQDGWAQGRLMNGIVASQGGEYRYTQIRLTGSYHSANDYEQDVDGCVVLGEGSADVAAGRINVKPIKVTCIFPGGRTRSWPAAGFVVDARDGIQGLAATLVNGGDARLAAATGAGLVQGAGALFAQRSITSTYTPLAGTASSIVTGNPALAAAGGAIDGAGRALGQEIQNYYAAYRPTVQTGGGVEVTVFLTTPLALPEAGRSVSTVRPAR